MEVVVFEGLCLTKQYDAPVVELADTTGLGPVAARYGGSNPPGRTVCSMCIFFVYRMGLSIRGALAT